MKNAIANPALWDATNPGHEAACRELCAVVAQAEQEELDRNGDERGVADAEDSLRSKFGVALEKLPSDMQRTDEYEHHAANALAFLVNQGVDAATVRPLYTDFEKAPIAFRGARIAPDVLQWSAAEVRGQAR